MVQFGSFAAFIEDCSTYDRDGEMKVIPHKEMTYAQGMKMFAVERHAVPEDFVGFSCSACSAIVATVATHNVRTMAVDRTHGVGRGR